MKICRDCKHCTTGPGQGIWGVVCGAVIYERATNPVTGEGEFKAKNDLGGVYYTNEPHPACHTVNREGECVLFEKGRA